MSLKQVSTNSPSCTLVSPSMTSVANCILTAKKMQSILLGSQFEMVSSNTSVKNMPLQTAHANVRRSWPRSWLRVEATSTATTADWATVFFECGSNTHDRFSKTIQRKMVTHMVVVRRGSVFDIYITFTTTLSPTQLCCQIEHKASLQA